jgi:hypothetical protein
MSPKATVALLIGADPKSPAKNRVMKIDPAFSLLAVPTDMTAWQNTAGKMLSLRPQISEIGAQKTGPIIKPTLSIVSSY